MTARVFILCSLFSITFAAAVSTEPTTPASCDPVTGEDCTPADCQRLCGCDKTFIFDEKKGGCVVNIEYLRNLTAAKNYDSEENDMELEDGIATKIRERVDKVFRGILISAVLFIVCASVCAVSVCVFCCHVRHTDGKLKKEVNAMAKKMNIKVDNESAPLVGKRDPIAESCNVVVQDANIMCV